MEEKRLKLETKENKRLFNRETGRKALENVKQKIIEANERKDFIYYIKKAVLFGSYLNSNKEKIVNKKEQNYSLKV